jgi:hypothetical protein
MIRETGGGDVNETQKSGGFFCLRLPFRFS